MGGCDLRSGVEEGADLRSREGRPRLYFSPPFGDAGMFICGHLMRGDFLVDPFHERHRCDIGSGGSGQASSRYSQIVPLSCSGCAAPPSWAGIRKAHKSRLRKALTFDAVGRFSGHHTHPYVSGSDMKNVVWNHEVVHAKPPLSK